MKNKTIYWVIAFIVLIMAVAVVKKIQEEPSQPEIISLWTAQERAEAMRNFKGTNYEKFAFKQLIYSIEAEISPQQFKDTLGSVWYLSAFKKQRGLSVYKYSVRLSHLMGKSKTEVQKILGKPVRTESVNPSGTPCPCDKLIYLNGLVEIVYINGSADWITINASPKRVIKDEYGYRSLNQFDDYTYIKVATD